MNLNQTISYLSNQFENQPSPFTKQEILNECFQMIKQDIHILETTSGDMLKQDNTKQIELVTQSLFIFIQYLILKPLSSDTILFITNMLQLIFNWNQNVTKIETIDLITKLIFQYINALNHINITISTLQKTSSIYQDLQNWMPPVFDISKIYCEELFKQTTE
jgi:hypothetical protein